jgi:hypothetical protein
MEIIIGLILALTGIEQPYALIQIMTNPLPQKMMIIALLPFLEDKKVL